jgi:hypothetical protein
LAAYVKPSELAMLDKAEKTYQLLATLKAAAPFEVELTPLSRIFGRNRSPSSHSRS